MRIDEVSKILNLSKSQIRYYEKIGILAIPRDVNQYRYFDDATMNDLKLIMDLKSLDIGLKDMKYIIELFHKPTTQTCNAHSVEYINKIIQEKENELHKQIRILNKLKRIHDLTKNNQYEQNKDAILIELNQRG